MQTSLQPWNSMIVLLTWNSSGVVMLSPSGFVFHCLLQRVRRDGGSVDRLGVSPLSLGRVRKKY
jgi:hypothetical protein